MASKLDVMDALHFANVDTRQPSLRWEWQHDGSGRLQFPTGARVMVPNCCLVQGELQLSRAAEDWFVRLLRSLAREMLLYHTLRIHSHKRVHDIGIVDCQGLPVRAEHLSGGPLTVTCEVWAIASKSAHRRLDQARSLVLMPRHIWGNSFYHDNVNLLMRGLDNRGIVLPIDFYSRLYFLAKRGFVK